ncbi:MAG TPA: phytanoyl-CoA dioxygenase family protein [Chthonomonadales bacterium]|nr:phytanoyl-CoA dioxygenase family protein [Chthonomonadales bacterium]
MRDVINETERAFYLENGYLVLRGALCREELERVQHATLQMIAGSDAGAQDFCFQGNTLARIEYVIDKSPALQALLANPFILRSVEKLMGHDLLPTWDAMVVKMPGSGAEAHWHVDAATECAGDTPIFNVDFYLDTAAKENCVWLIPGSHQWSEARRREWLARDAVVTCHTPQQYEALGGVPALMQPGDVMFHDIRTLHGSPQTTCPDLRRVVYYEFRTGEVELRLGPHRPDYIPLKQDMLRRCLQVRSAAYAIAGETEYDYCPTTSLDWSNEPQNTFRYPHENFWR